jgi:hypothetical protein
VYRVNVQTGLQCCPIFLLLIFITDILVSCLLMCYLFIHYQKILQGTSEFSQLLSSRCVIKLLDAISIMMIICIVATCSQSPHSVNICTARWHKPLFFITQHSLAGCWGRWDIQRTSTLFFKAECHCSSCLLGESMWKLGSWGMGHIAW